MQGVTKFGVHCCPSSLGRLYVSFTLYILSIQTAVLAQYFRPHIYLKIQTYAPENERICPPKVSRVLPAFQKDQAPCLLKEKYRKLIFQNFQASFYDSIAQQNLEQT